MQQATVRSLVGGTRIPHAKRCGQKKVPSPVWGVLKRGKGVAKSRVEQLPSTQRLGG